MRKNLLEYLYDNIDEKRDRVAFIDINESLTFGELYDISRRIGTKLSRVGVYREPVAICMDRRPAMIAAFLGVLAGGCYYVPLDTAAPVARVRSVIETSGARVMICGKDNLEKAAELGFEGKVLIYEEISVFRSLGINQIKDKSDSLIESTKNLCGVADTYEENVNINGGANNSGKDTKAPERDIDDAALARIFDAQIDTDPAYIVFTSGSTGTPKGVVACHRSVIDYIEHLSEILEVDESTVFGNQSPFYFDACLKEIYPTLKFGATAWIVPREYFMFTVKLVEFLNEHKINTICWVGSALRMVSALGTFKTVRPRYLRTVAFGSEVFPPKELRAWKEATPEGTKYINLYGPTEGTGMCCFYRVDREFEDGDAIPIGRPFPNREILLLSDDGREVADGETGEIYVRGTCVTLGYFNNPEKTGESFVQNPLNNAYPEILYKTGDLARRNERGELVFVSRKDYQIKHMGHRIELGEIESVAGTINGVEIVACVYDSKADRIIMIYKGEAEETAVSNHLKETLPRYMLPGRIVRVVRMPFTPGGKIDRKGLAETYMQGKS
ncbi:MAG: amino acid adenylation domain-containing protein [Lachnospiraceae bacterium]|nr:amino acid adenylation domain-containing protein [Lachnospiraceae bacterium]